MCRATVISTPDHPRVCGEQHYHIYHIDDGGGSPPRVRGTASSYPLALSIRRITPACAGNRVHYIVPSVWLPDHPRVCGEQIREGYANACCVGSPPRVRGTALDIGSIPIESRITPACAGNRLRKSRSYLGFYHSRVSISMSF